MVEVNKIICGDCLEVMKGIPDKSIDLVLTDPPYGINYRSNMRRDKFDFIKNDNNLDWLPDWVKETYRILKQNTSLYCFTRWDVYPTFYQCISEYFNIKNCIIIKRLKRSFGGDLKSSFSYSYDMIIYANKGKKCFEKTKYRLANNHSRHGEKPYKGYIFRYEDLIIDCPASERKDIQHPTQKTIDINKFFISLSSKENDIVLDPFLGSGTTAVACRELNRRYIGIEISEKYCEIARRRIKAIPELLF